MDTEALKKSLLKKFQEVTADRLQKIQLGVIDLEKETAEQAADDVARELHTMKGEARMLGLAAIGQLAHAAEDVLRAEREGKTATETATDVMLRACDVLSDLIEDLDAAHTGSSATEEMVKALSDVSGHPVPALGPVRKPAAAPPKPAVQAPVAPPAAVVQAPVPAPAPAQAAPRAADPGVVAAPAPAAKEEEAPNIAKSNSIADRSIRVNVEVLDSLGLLAGDLLVESARGRLRSTETAQLFERFSRLGDRFLRISEDVDVPDAIRTELERAEADLHMLRDDAFRFVRRNGDGINTLHGNLAQLADHVAEARLVPLSTVFDAFPRAVRDIAKTQNKEVDLVIENADIGVDRSMLADVRDALVHLLRNAVDHGLESPDFRQQMGKPDTGRIRIRVRVDGDMLHIEVEDDGRGMDTERLKQVAINKRLLSPVQAAALSEREAIELIFRPGFSTREQVSELSGRGVGMDVVKRKVETLGGSVGVQSRQGRGTTITLRLPQSLALMKVLLVRLGDDVYGMPAADVVAVMRIKPDDRMEVFGTLAVRHRGKPTALVALGPLLGLNGGNRFDKPPAVVVRHGDDYAALVVDGFVDEREVAVKPCGGEFLKGAPFIAGTAALEDGRIAVLLHVPDIMTEVRRMARPVTQAPASRRLRVLLVDDSPIARATEGALVKALGHSVEEAQDGEEAYVKVQTNTYDLILTDVQMPKLDGFSLTRRLKGTPAVARIPVIILSSLASPEDKRRGLDAGADAYLVKGELGVEILAQSIDRLT
ncbi:hybrid sensor histidine kinase/response regulator [Corallococcus exiguus]|uniref:hybrid sensor histidine kinase/response regulator n=1 Tax=Corallococcus TaxID=83461 RepID=UPI000EDB2244|nr:MULTISPECIES: response regulator [Corallococcus]NNB87128.1 hybrid sensor histidine kinase/response regulator [Corallococcus exiguus]NNB94683.1 hybrid sensor histidine kinase/response regulator [Corallococcus exiguus]NNC03255.1 hybrid sensor histidine kinase/response regulator [Corallococcus exiguus]NPC48035.1 hybrid sensor histidine kinase/response regulator [Corallococcus exiguus]RKH82202.1 hybrid sensor histidine kinase/response regulator [Corallococcus sp. AB032C]